MSTYSHSIMHTIENEEAPTSNIYVNKFDLGSVKINAMRRIDDGHVDMIAYRQAVNLTDFDIYQEYEIYVQKLDQPNSILENQTVCSSKNSAKKPPSTNQEKITPRYYGIKKNTSGDVIFVKENMFLNFYHYNMLIPDGNDTYICLCCVEALDSTEACRNHVELETHKTELRKQTYLVKFTNNIIRRVHDTCYHCGLCNKVLLKKDLDNHVENDKDHDTLKRYGIAYAGHVLQKKPELDITKYISVQVAGEDIMLHEQHWHMCCEFPRKYFCTLCVAGGDKELLQTHLESSGHLLRLSKCQILPEYGLSVVRSLSENHHHCGVCNTYVIVDVVDNHIGKPKHKANLSAWMEFTKQQKTETNKNESVEDNEGKAEITEEKSVEDKAEIKEEKNVTRVNVHEKSADSKIPDEDLVVEHSGIKYCLNILSFNCVVKTQTAFYCVCCSMYMEHGEVRNHMNLDRHKISLCKSEVIAEFPGNFMRKINSGTQVWVHCGICNSRMTYNTTHLLGHVETAKHKNNFAQHAEKVSKISKQIVVARTIPKNPTPTLSKNSEKYSHEVEISDQKYSLNLHTFRAWHTIRGWGMYFSCCFACQTLLTNATMYRHTRSQEHKENLKNCVVLECYSTNYLKVVDYSYAVYCTFCNDLIDSPDIESHVKSASHTAKKELCLTKLDNKSNSGSEFLVRLINLLQPLGSYTDGDTKESEKGNLKNYEIAVKTNPSSHQECNNVAIAVPNSSKLPEFQDEHSMNPGLVKHRNCSVGVMQERTDKFNVLAPKTFFTMDYSKYVILYYLQDKILLTYNAWNTVVENTFCATCKEKFIKDAKSHCSEPTHIKKMKSVCYELSDGSVARKYSKSKVVCLLCSSVVKILAVDTHVRSRDHLDNLNKARASITQIQTSQQNMATVPMNSASVSITSEMESSQKNEAIASMNPVPISVKRIQRNVSVQNQEELFDERVLLEFGNSKLVLTYNSWNGIRENRMTCIVCSDDGVTSYDHCNDDTHIINMRKRVVESEFMRKVTKTHSYCMICNFIGNHFQSKDHIDSETHRSNIKTAREQAASLADSGIQVINCSQYFNLNHLVYSQNVLRPVEKPVSSKYIVDCNTNESPTDEDCDLKEISKNRDDTYIMSGEGNILIPNICKRTHYAKMAVKNIITTSNLISTHGTADDRKVPATAVESPRKMENHIETVGCLSVSNMHEGGTSKIQSTKSLSAINQGDATDLVTEESNAGNNILHASQVTAIGTEFCHVCGMDVPSQFYIEHMKSVYHNKIAELMQIILERVKNGFNRIPTNLNKSNVQKNVHYCSTCNCTLKYEEFIEHDRSDLHKGSVEKINILERAICVLQSSENNLLTGIHTEESVSVACRPKDDAKITMGMRKSEEPDKVKVEDSTLLPNLEKQENTVNCSKFERSEACSLDMSDAIQTENIKEVDLNLPRDINVTVVGTGNKYVILQYENRKFCIELLSYHGVYPKPENSLWCVLCKVKEDDVHLISEKHLSRLSELKFNGVDLIRYLSTSHAHCALCHLMLAVTELEEHLNSETHLNNRSSAKVLSGDELVRDDCTMSKLKDFLSTHLSESNDSELAQTDNTVNDDKDLASDQTEYNADDLKVSDSVISVRSQTTELKPSADIIPQLEADIKSDGEAQKIVPNEVKPCSSNGHVSPVCNFELPSVNQKPDYDKSLPYTDTDCQSRIGSGCRSPLTATTLNVASVTNKSKADNIIIENEFIRSHAATDFPYSCILCDVKMSYFDHVWDHLKGMKHTQKLKNLNSKSVETREKAGDCTGMSLPLSHSSRNITLDNVSVGSVQNSLAVKNTPVAEHSSEISCTMCHVNVPNAIWEQHTQGAEHNLKLREHMTLKYNVQGCDKTLTDDSSALETEDNVQTLSLEAKSVRSTIEAQVNFKTKQNSALVEVKPCSQANKITVIENENELHKIAINKNFDSKIIPTQKATPNMQIKSDFILFVPKSVTCPYLCSLCNAKMPSLHHVQEHLNGSRHMLNLKTLSDRVASTAKVNTKGSTSIGTLVTQPDQSKKVTMTTPSNPSCSTDASKKLKKSGPTICAICNVEVPIAIWKQHVKGKTHRSKLNQVEQINSPASSGLNLCDLADSLGDLEQNLTSLMNLEHFIARLRNTNVEGQARGKAQSSAGHVQPQSILPTQASSSTNKIVKPKNPGQTVCTICRVNVPMSNMIEHVQGKPHLQNLRMMNT